MMKIKSKPAGEDSRAGYPRLFQHVGNVNRYTANAIDRAQWILGETKKPSKNNR